jgi:hypothetical protein
LRSRAADRHPWVIKFLGGIYLIAGLAVIVGLIVGTLNGNGPNPVALVLVLIGVVIILGLAASFLGPASWAPRLKPVLSAGLGLMLLLLVVTCFVAPGLVADTRSTRGPTTEHGARVLGVVMLVPASLLVGLPLLTHWLRRRSRARHGRPDPT